MHLGLKMTFLTCVLLLAMATGANRNPENSNPRKLPRGVKCLIDQKPVTNRKSFVQYKQGKVYFCCQDCARQFQRAPSKYKAWANHHLVLTKQYVQKACPLSGETPDEDSVVLKVAGVDVDLLCAGCRDDISKLALMKQIHMLFDEEAFKEGKFKLRPKNAKK